jgi:hypothetical protein
MARFAVLNVQPEMNSGLTAYGASGRPVQVIASKKRVSQSSVRTTPVEIRGSERESGRGSVARWSNPAGRRLA